MWVCVCPKLPKLPEGSLKTFNNGHNFWEFGFIQIYWCSITQISILRRNQFFRRTILHWSYKTALVDVNSNYQEFKEFSQNVIHFQSSNKTNHFWSFNLRAKIPKYMMMTQLRGHGCNQDSGEYTFFIFGISISLFIEGMKCLGIIQGWQ